MSKTMEDVLAEHGVFEFDDESRLYRCRCGVWMADEDVAAHQAAALSAAGFGPVQAARAEALEEAAKSWSTRADVADRFGAWWWLRARAEAERGEG